MRLALSPTPSTLRVLQMALTAALVLLAIGGAPLSTAKADTITYDFSTCIDGEDQLIVQGNTLQWRYISWLPVGMPRDSPLAGPLYGSPSDCSQNYTSISSTLNGSPVTSVVQFTPTFPGPYYTDIGGGFIFNPMLSDVFTGLDPAFPSTDMIVSLDVLQGRGSLTIDQLPTLSNGETLILDFNDASLGGMRLYAAEITITTPSAPIPEPTSLALLAMGLVGLVALSGLRSQPRAASIAGNR